MSKPAALHCTLTTARCRLYQGALAVPLLANLSGLVGRISQRFRPHTRKQFVPYQHGVPQYTPQMETPADVLAAAENVHPQPALYS